tara:strand:- start:343 stop:1506 length:1164 start_codon:yes stop_codon:yes gene_type:complete
MEVNKISTRLVSEISKKLNFPENQASVFERNAKIFERNFKCDNGLEEDLIAAKENFFSPALQWVKINDHWIEGTRVIAVDYKLNVSSTVVPKVDKVANLHSSPEIPELFSNKTHFSIFEDCISFILDVRLERAIGDVFANLEPTYCYNVLIESSLGLPVFLIPIFCYTLKASTNSNPLYCVQRIQQFLRNHKNTLLIYNADKEVLHQVIKKAVCFKSYDKFVVAYPGLKESLKSSIENRLEVASICSTFKSELSHISKSAVPKRRTDLKVRVAGAATGLGMVGYSGFWLYQNYGTQVYNGDRVNIFQGPRGRSVAKTTGLIVKSVGSLSVCVAGSIDAFISPFKKVFFKNLDIFSSPFKKFLGVALSTAKESVEIAGTALKDVSEGK